MSSRVSAEAADLIVRYTQAGLGRQEIADRIGCSVDTVSNVRRRRGVRVRHSYRLSAEQLARAEQLLDDGASFAEAARSIGSTTSAVARRFPGRGWSYRECGLFTAMLRQIEVSA